MAKYIDIDCQYCEFWDSIYGCMEHSCQLYIDHQQGLEEMAADFDHDKRKDDFYDKEQGELW